MDLFLGFLHFVSDLLNNVDFIKGFFLGGLFGLLGMITWRRKRIKDLQSDIVFDRERYAEDRKGLLQEIERLKKENASLIINASAKHFKP